MLWALLVHDSPAEAQVRYTYLAVLSWVHSGVHCGRQLGSGDMVAELPMQCVNRRMEPAWQVTHSVTQKPSSFT